MIDNMTKIIRITAHIQRKKGELFLDGKRVICVWFDGTCAVEGEATGEFPLSFKQLDHLFKQTLGESASQAV